jgi:hypothetical protein
MGGDTMKNYGHKTYRNKDGLVRHVRMTESEITEILARIEKEESDRVKKMPDEKTAISQLFEAVTRLKELGWNDAIYCPKDGSVFSAIEHGSTGIHECNYTGEWPTGRWTVYDGDAWPSRPILWRPRKDTDAVVNKGPCTMGLEIGD